MAKYIDWYLVQMENRLRPQLDAERLHEALMEAETHLYGIADELVEKGMDLASAEQAAISRFGSVENLAGRKAPQEAASSKGVWILPGVLLSLSLLFVYAGILMHDNAATAIFWAAALVLLIVSAVTCLRKGKMPVIAFALLLFGGFGGASIMASHTYYSPGLMLARRAMKPQVVNALNTDIARAEDGIASFRAFMSASHPTHEEGGYPLPDLNVRPMHLAAVGLDPVVSRAQMRLDNPVYTPPNAFSRRVDSIADRRQQGDSDLAQAMRNLGTLKAARIELDRSDTYSEEVLAGSVAGGVSLSLLWIALACILNAFANLIAKLSTPRPLPISITVTPKAYQ